jgi:DNA replication protein DnaC
MPGTAIALRTSDNQGAAQKSADHILSITYPTADVQTALKAISTKRNGCPIVLMGDRGRGKSHIMAVMHHAIQSPDIVEKWSKNWGMNIGCDELKSYEIVKGYVQFPNLFITMNICFSGIFCLTGILKGNIIVVNSRV